MSASTASSSATTSPSSFTAASERDHPARGERDLRELGDREDLERRADAEEHVCLARERRRPGQRRLGQQLAEQHDVGLERGAAVAPRHAVVGRRQALPHHVELAPRPAGEAA
jgi:hypothetical protein